MLWILAYALLSLASNAWFMTLAFHAPILDEGLLEA